MKNPFSQTLKLVGLFLVLVLFVYFYASDGARQSSRQSEIEASYFSSSDLQSLDSVIFQLSAEDVRSLEKSEGQWKYEGVVIQEMLAEDLESALASFPYGRKVSTNPDNWEQYGVTDDSPSITLKRDEQPLSVIRLGDRTAGPGGLFVRRDDDPAVYQVVTSLTQYQYYDLSEWGEKALFPRNEEVVGLTTRIQDERWEFLLKEDTWYVVLDGSENEVQNQEELQNMVKSLKNMRAEQLSTDMSLFENADNAVVFQYQDGSEVVLNIDTGEEKSYAQVTGSNVVYVLNSDLAEELRPSFLAVEEISEEA